MGGKLAGQARQGTAAHHDAARALPGPDLHDRAAKVLLPLLA